MAKRWMCNEIDFNIYALVVAGYGYDSHSLHIALTAAGCGSGDAGPTTYAATGTVTYQGKPIEGANMTFHAGESGVTAMAMTE